MVWPIDLIVENVYIDGVDELSLASYGHRWLKVDLRAWMQRNTTQLTPGDLMLIDRSASLLIK